MNVRSVDYSIWNCECLSIWNQNSSAWLKVSRFFVDYLPITKITLLPSTAAKLSPNYEKNQPSK